MSYDEGASDFAREMYRMAAECARLRGALRDVQAQLEGRRHAAQGEDPLAVYIASVLSKTVEVTP